MDEFRRHRRFRWIAGAGLLVLLQVATTGVAQAQTETAVCPPTGSTQPDSVNDPTGQPVQQAVVDLKTQGFDVTVMGPEQGLPPDALVAAWGAVTLASRTGGRAVLCAGTVVPDLVELSVADARTALEDALLVPLDDDADADEVVASQDPQAGTLVPYNSAVSMETSAPAPSPRTAVVPPLLGMTAGAAGSALAAAGLELGATTGDSDGFVVGQSLEPGSEVPLGTPVSVELEVSLVSVPDVRGLSAGAARTAVGDAGLVLEVQEGDTGTAGLVFEQDPAPATQVRPGTRVLVFVPVAAETAAPSSDGRWVLVAAVLGLGCLVLLLLLVRDALRRRARRRVRARVRTVARRGAVSTEVSDWTMGPPTRAVRVEVRPDRGVQELEEAAP